MATKKSAARPKLGPGRLSAEESAQIPDRLMDAAHDLFIERGFGETTMDEIARRAGASTKTLYSRYANKSEILQAVVRRIVDKTIQTHMSATPAPAPTNDPKGYLESLCVQICMQISNEGARLTRFAHMEAHNFPEIRQIHDMAMRHGVMLVRSALDRWRSEGLLPELTDMDRSAALCLSMTTDWARLRTALGAAPSRLEIEENVRFAVDFFLRGCGFIEAGPRRKAATKK